MAKKERADEHQEEWKTPQSEEVSLKEKLKKKDNPCKELETVMQEKHGDVLIEDMTKKVMEQYVFVLERLFDEAKASALGAATALLQALHKAVSQTKGNAEETEDSATKTEGPVSKEEDNN
ncbi:hypothetical protein R1flu_001122 [Riccia fluitans]|uniref:Uncharacterized protein n=1 Tax=Riccia fluitans TaxID=41844 RepID=A0ABD1Y5B2_9MARC